MGKYIKRSELKDLINAVIVEDNEYVSADKLIKILRNMEGINIPPIRMIDDKIVALESFADENENWHITNKCKIERSTSTLGDCKKITRRTLIEWEKSMRSLGYNPRYSHSEYCEQRNLNIFQVVKFLKRMRKDQKESDM